MYILHSDHVQLGNAWIPLDIENADFQAYENWVAAGNTPQQPAPPSHASLWERAINEIRAKRQPIIEVLDGLQASALTLGLSERAQVIETAKDGLRNITKIDLRDCPTYEAMEVKVMSAYIVIAGALPSDLRQAFSEATR